MMYIFFTGEEVAIIHLLAGPHIVVALVTHHHHILGPAAAATQSRTTASTAASLRSSASRCLAARTGEMGSEARDCSRAEDSGVEEVWNESSENTVEAQTR